MYKYTVLSCYGTIIIAIVVTIWYLWRVLKKKKLVSLTVQNSTEYKINIVLKIILGIILIAIHLKGTIPAIRDIPYVLDNNLNKIEGVAISSDKKKNDADWHLRSFLIKSGEDKIKVYVRTGQVEKGDHFEIRYLPHTHLGEVLDRR